MRPVETISGMMIVIIKEKDGLCGFQNYIFQELL
jgi:hypothetical protein